MINNINYLRLCLLLLPSFLSVSCVEISEQPKKHSFCANSENVLINLKNISFTLNKFDYHSKNDSLVVWYYPYEMIFKFELLNNSQNGLFFASKESEFNQKENFGTLRCNYNGKNYFIGSNSFYFVESKSTIFFYGYILDLPIFDSIYNYREFTGFLNKFKKESRYKYTPIIEEYNQFEIKDNDIYVRITDLLNSKSININFSPDFHYKYNYWQGGKVKTSQIGYPTRDVPEEIEIAKPIHGIEY